MNVSVEERVLKNNYINSIPISYVKVFIAIYDTKGVVRIGYYYSTNRHGVEFKYQNYCIYNNMPL